MHLDIELYRGYQIKFDTNTETFYCFIVNDRNEKDSYSALKKKIDEHIKLNQTFEPFLVCNKNGMNITKIVQMRKDRRFVSEDKNGNRAQISEGYADDLFLYREDDIPVYKEMERLRSEAQKLQAQAIALRETIKPPTLNSIKNKYII